MNAGPPRARRWLALMAVAVTATVLHPLPTDAGAAPAGRAAGGGGGASSTVGGRGDIITTILFPRSGGRTRPGNSRRCYWYTFNTTQLEWLVAVGIHHIATGGTASAIELLRPYLNTALPDGELQGYRCGSTFSDFRYVERVQPLATSELLQRRLVTRLPAPELVMSPPASVAVPVGSPVFVGVDPMQWRTVEAEMELDGVVAQVRATPQHLRIVSGTTEGTVTTCDGPGIRYVVGSGSAAEQAASADACTIVFGAASAGGTTGRSPRAKSFDFDRPDRWIGSITVVWSARWRVNDGPWQSLGDVPRTRLFDRTAREVAASIEAGR